MTSHSNLSPVCLPPAIGILAFWGGVVAVCSCCAPFADILQLHHNYLLVTPSSLSLSFFASLFTRSFSIWRFMVRTSSLCVTSSWPCGFFLLVGSIAVLQRLFVLPPHLCNSCLVPSLSWGFQRKTTIPLFVFSVSFLSHYSFTMLSIYMYVFDIE